MKNNRASRGPSQRQRRAGELIRHALVDILRKEDIDDAALEGLSVTISEVVPSPDLRQADIYCTAFGQTLDRVEASPVIAALNRHAGYLRGLLGRAIDLKFTPALRFREDRSFEEARRIESLLASPEVARDIDPDRASDE